MTRYVLRSGEATHGRVIHKSHAWHRQDVVCGGAVLLNIRLTKEEVTRRLERGSILCPRCFPA
ncbi:hypothetical protein ABR737_01665 [Streptomyces sp. Edi2]|uniref:hypothetical protein n=1 Tax=Streptomyces sp. Edi2 TaxID=3162528 RepID=UPI003305FE39